MRYRDRLNVLVRHLVVTLPVFAAAGFWLWLMAGFLGASRLADGGLAHLPFLIPFAVIETLVMLVGFPPLGLLVIVFFLALNCAQTLTPDDWRGGAGLGPRYLVPSLPFFSILPNQPPL